MEILSTVRSRSDLMVSPFRSKTELTVAGVALRRLPSSKATAGLRSEVLRLPPVSPNLRSHRSPPPSPSTHLSPPSRLLRTSHPRQRVAPISHRYILRLV